ncbi:hypothetical protein DWB68_10215 [Galactobacter valiniphilus]|uniref:Uncharacterized protein n=1 Tax=Galactobacter valiniphilus TaxID=2676122 RepID=A0A399J8H1_9MICC|nr:hypothetical protein [Galactobacter valiniphilus]RII41891.1 hypothetical protein DWB68_10215 [Galactobacter valiniphilus]
MIWLGWVLSALVIASGVLVCIWAVRHDVHSPSRALMGRKPGPDPVAEHYAARRRERTSALTEWERDFRRAQGLPEPATTTLGRGEAVVPVSRMLTTANRLMWPPTLAELNPARDVECVIDTLPRHDVPHMPAEYLTQEHVGQMICAPHSGPALPHGTWRVPAGTITAVHEADVIEDHALCDEPHTIVTGVNLEIDGRAIHLPPRQPVRLTLPR